MPQSIIDASLEVYKSVDSDDPKLTIDGEDIMNASLTSRIQGWKDECDFEIDNYDGKYTSDSTNIVVGDVLLFRADGIGYSVTKADDSRFGRFRYGGGTFGGAGGTHQVEWLGRVTGTRVQQSGGSIMDLKLRSSDYVFETLSHRRLYTSYEDRQISGHIDAIVDDIMSRNVREVDRSGIGEITDTTGIEVNGEDILETMRTMAERGDAILASDMDVLIFEPAEDIPIVFTLENRDFDVFEPETNDDELFNDVRVDGARDNKLDDSQEDVSGGTEVVTESIRKTAPLNPETFRLDTASLYTRKTGTHESIRVRIQRPNEDNTGPRAIDDESRDIESAELTAQFLAEDEWVDEGFRFRREPLPENPWLIVESTGPGGQLVGVDSDGNLAFKTFYPFRIAVRDRDIDSIVKYGLRSERIKDDSIFSFSVARDIAEAFLERHKEPERIAVMEAMSERAHRLKPADMVKVEEPLLDIDEPWIVTERNDEFAGGPSRLNTTITVQRVDTL